MEKSKEAEKQITGEWVKLGNWAGGSKWRNDQQLEREADRLRVRGTNKQDQENKKEERNLSLIKQ